MHTNLTLISTAFANGGMIPAKYTCDGDKLLSPPLSIGGVPEAAKSLVLIMDDPDIPKAVQELRGIKVFDHWVLYNIPADTTEIPEGVAIGTAGLNGTGKGGYIGPCPPPEYEPSEHRYVFKLYALREALALGAGVKKREVLDALVSLLIAEAELIGRYSRK